MKKKKFLINLISILVILGAFITLVYYANKDRSKYISTKDFGVEYEVARVIEIISDDSVIDDSSIRRGSMEVKLEILSGRYKGEIVEVTNYFSAIYNVYVKEGEKVSVRISTSAVDEYTVSIYNHHRVPTIFASIIFFIVALTIIGGKKGFKAVIGLIFTMVSIIFILLPLALKGFPVLLVTLIIILISNFICFFLIDGICTKTIVAAIGSVGGVILGALFAMVVSSIMHITTFQMEEAEALMLITSTSKLKLSGLFISGILIACTGAVMDVAMSIASSVNELCEVNPTMTRKELFLSGMNIGRDAMGTMANTLILAFAGNSLNMMIVIYSYGVSFQQLMNTDFIAIELIRAIAGSIGIVFTVPLVAFISSYALSKKKK